MASSTGYGASYPHLDAFGCLQKQNDLEAPSDEDEDAFETVRAVDKLQVPLDANARTLMSI